MQDSESLNLYSLRQKDEGMVRPFEAFERKNGQNEQLSKGELCSQ
ncbi:hypothetical protein PALB_13170 [Pseudoalteromonas luteoviolacea B = ATCC 29581]|nr:hypothetical protein PALB_13170 [Pseudoalteromonas luteoviolacea B = ATCC 29581]